MGRAGPFGARVLICLDCLSVGLDRPEDRAHGSQESPRWTGARVGSSAGILRFNGFIAWVLAICRFHLTGICGDRNSGGDDQGMGAVHLTQSCAGASHPRGTCARQGSAPRAPVRHDRTCRAGGRSRGLDTEPSPSSKPVRRRGSSSATPSDSLRGPLILWRIGRPLCPEYEGSMLHLRALNRIVWTP